MAFCIVMLLAFMTELFKAACMRQINRNSAGLHLMMWPPSLHFSNG